MVGSEDVALRSDEPRRPSGNTLAFNAEDPGSTPGPGEIKYTSRPTADRISGFQFTLTLASGSLYQMQSLLFFSC